MLIKLVLNKIKEERERRKKELNWLSSNQKVEPPGINEKTNTNRKRKLVPRNRFLLIIKG